MWFGAFSENLERRQVGRYYGLITRARYSEPVSMAKATDGLSNTLLIGEKWLNAAHYESGDWHDDRGWTDGWDTDTIRVTGYPPRPDSSTRRAASQVTTTPRPTPSAARTRPACTSCLAMAPCS